MGRSSRVSSRFSTRVCTCIVLVFTFNSIVWALTYLRYRFALILLK